MIDSRVEGNWSTNDFVGGVWDLISFFSHNKTDKIPKSLFCFFYFLSFLFFKKKRFIDLREISVSGKLVGYKLIFLELLKSLKAVAFRFKKPSIFNLICANLSQPSYSRWLNKTYTTCIPRKPMNTIPISSIMNMKGFSRIMALNIII